MSQAQIRVRLFDGARLPLGPTTQVLLTLRPQFSSDPLFSGFRRGNDFTFNVAVPEDGSGFAILASAKGFEDAGISPVKVGDGRTSDVHLMLLRRNSTFQFARARWERLDERPSLLRFLMGFDTGAGKMRARYTDLIEFQPDSLACLLNITAALELLPMQNSTLGFQNGLDYLKAVEWGEGIRKDRFFATASGALLTDMRQATATGLFERELSPGVFHPGAVESYKQIEFGEANLQITFHDQVFIPATDKALIRVELDMDYYRDRLSHALLEVIPNTLSGGQRKTSPRQVHVMRWMAGKARNQDYDPLYVSA